MLATRREDLIAAWPNCNFDCLTIEKKQCCCETCAKENGFWEDGEIEMYVDNGIFSQEDVKLIKSLLSIETGYLGDMGCKLPVRLRPSACLMYDCRGKE